eukprot:TRINITY_DN12581_c0_g2_i2.p3 TRINITY_DN12581_c0_g2~~TRINITY_DN12581_c0_g2_i2.p3  ORF type:complete len:152 (+),score=33.64 TRINITY_DN12581_c0_g2_i2:662-1117(+)
MPTPQAPAAQSVGQPPQGTQSSLLSSPAGGPNPENYAKALAEKVRRQAEQLIDAERYRALCERRIADLSPGHPFPVTTAHLGQPGTGPSTQRGGLSGRGNEALLLQQMEELQKQLRDKENELAKEKEAHHCLLYTSPSPRDGLLSRMPSSA